MTKLGVNIDHSATLRQARYRGYPADTTVIIEPDVLEIALLAEKAGADSITAHLREDRRHINDRDVRRLKDNIATKLNLEMACNDDVLKVALQVVPAYACLVPENRAEVTTEGGLDLVANFEKTKRVVDALGQKGVVVSLFIDPEERQIEAAKKMGAPVVELHTGAYANAWGNGTEVEKQLDRLANAAKLAQQLGITVNSGHGINYANVSRLLAKASFNELNIGHSIVCRALSVGMESAVAQMKTLISNAR